MDKLDLYYNDYNEDLRLKKNSTKIEFDVTVNILEKHINNSVEILDIGAGVGNYSIYYAEKGYKITAIEPVQKNINIFKINMENLVNKPDLYKGSICDMSLIKDESKDIVLALGPFYHLRKLEERQKALFEVCRVLKKGGIFAMAYINKYFLMNYHALRSPGIINTDYLKHLDINGTIDAPEADDFSKIVYCSTPEGNVALMRSFGLKIIDHLATDGLTKFVADGINTFSDIQYKEWFLYHLENCRNPSVLGASNHGLIIGRK